MRKVLLLSLSTLFLISCGEDENETTTNEQINQITEAELIKKLDKNSELMAYFPFNNSAKDESSNSNNGEANNVQITTDRFGNENSAYKFTKADDSYIQIPSFGEVSSFTITAWIKLSSLDKNNEAYNVIVSKYKTSREYVFRQNSKDYGQALNAHFETLSGSTQNLSFNTLVPDVWIHVGMSYDNGKVTLYHNGEKSEVKTISPIKWGQGSVLIGSLDGTEHFDGIIDDVLFVNRALTSDEIKILADNK